MSKTLVKWIYYWEVIHLNCGGKVLLATVNHSLCDATGASQIFNAWADITRNPSFTISITPVHSNQLLKARSPPHPIFTHPQYSIPSSDFNITHSIMSQPLVPVSVTFTPSQIHYLKKQCFPSFKCTSFEALASHLWRSWVEVMDLPASLNVKLIFPVNARKKLSHNYMRDGYYRNAFVLACAESKVDELIALDHLRYGAELVNAAKEKVDDEYVQSVIDLVQVRKSKLSVDLSASLFISQWARLGLEDVDFGDGTPVHMGTLQSDFYGMFLPVTGDLHATRMLISVPQRVSEKFEFLLRDVGEENGPKEANWSN